jgi:hypothetical protein
MKIYRAGYSRCIIERRESYYYAVSFLAFYWISRRLQQKVELVTVWKLHFWNLRLISFLSLPYSCIKRLFVKIYRAGYPRCIIEKDVKVNFMRFRTLRSIEFQGVCSRNWNITRSKNYIIGICGPLAFYQCLTRVSKDSSWRYTEQLFQVHNRKRRES